jgi:hypothetical protein
MRKILRRRLKLAVKVKRERKALKAVQKAIRAFKPKANDKLTFVFINLKGQRQKSGSTVKGVMVYVNSKKRKEPVRYKARVKLRPVKQTVFKLHGQKRKIAAKKFYEARTFKIKESSIRKTATEKSTGINWQRFSVKAGKDLRATVERFGSSRGQYVIDAAVTIRYKDGKTRVVNISVNFNKSERQVLTSKNYQKFILGKISQELGRALDRIDVVTKTSARFIRRLKANKGEERAEWTDKRGHRWLRNESTEVTVERIDYRVNRITVKG